jgi:MFS family permease
MAADGRRAPDADALGHGADDGEPRGSYRLMFAPSLGPFFWGKVLSSSGIWVHNVTAAIVAFQVTGSAFVVGLVSAVQFAPQLLLAPLSGKMADRGNAPVQIVVGRLLVTAGAGGMAATLWAVGGVAGLQNAGPVLLASLVVGLGFVVGGPAMQSVVPTMIRPGELAAAMALNSVPMVIARAAGPAIGATVATQAGYAAAFGIAAASNLVHALVVLALRIPAVKPARDTTDFSVRTALRHIRQDRPLLVLLLGIAAVGAGADPAITLAPALAARLDAGAGMVGWVASSFGLGAACGFLVFGPIVGAVGLPRTTAGGLWLMASGLVVAAAATSPGFVLASFGVAGAGMTFAFSAITTQIQERSPDALRGRIMALWFVGWLGMRPFAAAMNGLLTDVADVVAALLVTAAVVAGAAVMCRPSRL